LRTAYRPFAYCVPSNPPSPLNTTYQKGGVTLIKDRKEVIHFRKVAECYYKIIMRNKHMLVLPCIRLSWDKHVFASVIKRSFLQMAKHTATYSVLCNKLWFTVNEIKHTNMYDNGFPWCVAYIRHTFSKQEENKLFTIFHCRCNESIDREIIWLVP